MNAISYENLISDLFAKLINNCKVAHEALEAIDTITVTADPLSPMKHIRLIENNSEEALREICNRVSGFVWDPLGLSFQYRYGRVAQLVRASC